VPKFVPRETDGAPSTGPLIMKRLMTLTKGQITKSAVADDDAAHNSLLDCILCKNIMIQPRECDKCRKGFCHSCIDSYINQMINGDYQICCPNCSSTSFLLVDPHPLLTRQLSAIKARCANADKGCTDTLAYGDLAKHQDECGYAMLKCVNYGCEGEFYQKDAAQHEAGCEFRVDRCDKCDVVKIKDEEHDCIK